MQACDRNLYNHRAASCHELASYYAEQLDWYLRKIERLRRIAERI